MNVAIRSNLKTLHLQKQAAEDRKIPYDEINEATGIAKSTISALMNNKITRYDAETLDRLCEFYNCTPGDLLIRV